MSVEYLGVPERAVERFEQFVAYGAPSCDVCMSLDTEERADIDTAPVWPDSPIFYLRGDCRPAVDFLQTCLCDHHDTPDNRPEGATHRVVADMEYIGDEHHMNSAYAHRAADVEVLE